MAAKAPLISWTVSSAVQDVTRKVAVALMAVWLIYIGAKYALPSNRASGGGKVKPLQIILAGLICVILFDLNLFISGLNGAASLIQSAWDMFSSIRVG